MSKARRASARRSRPRRSGKPKLAGRLLRVGDRDVPLLSGAMHYWRLERSAWKPGLTQLRDLGLPIVETYVPWQVHETAPGQYDFGEQDGRKDVGAFVDMAHEIGLYVFVRPGPHINAEMTYFGLPERIVYDRACQARSPRQNPVLQGFPPRMFPVPSYASKTFHDEVGRWFDAVGEVLAPRLWPAGPIVLLQVDNEASYYFRDAAYDQDYHPDALALWRKYLEKRYGTLAKVAEAHRREYARWDDCEPPERFRAESSEELALHLDWGAFREDLITQSLAKMKRRLSKAGLKGAVTVHNFPLGDQGVPMSSTAIEGVVDLVGFDYYHARREHRAIKRRTLYLAGTHPVPYAPEMGIGAPAWFTPLANEDSLFTTMTALAYGLRGFNLYMAVDRDRWYGAPIDARGNPRVEAGAWKQLLGALDRVSFASLSRRAEVGLMMPREYARLSRATSLLGMFSPTVLEAIGGSPVEACREDAFGFEGPIQVLWWKLVARFADALTHAGVPYVYVDGDVAPERLEALKVLITPSFELCDPARWKRVTAFAEHGGTVVYGPAMPGLDLAARRTLFEVPHDGRRVLIDTDDDARAVVDELVADLELARPYRVRPAPLETCVHEGSAGARVLFVINPGKRRLEARIDVPGPTTFEDLLTGERFEGPHEVVVPMGGWSCRMLSLESRAQEGEGSGNGGGLVISDALRFEGFDSRSWTNLISLFAPNVVSRLDREAVDSDAPEVDESETAERRGTLLIVLDDRERVLKAMHTHRGRVTGLEYEGPDALAEMAARYGATSCVVMREGVVEEIGERVAHRVERGDDYLAQLLVMARAIREMSEAGLLITWPRPLGGVPIPTIGMVNRALDSVLPDEHAMVVVVWNRAAPWTAMVLRRRGGLIDLIAGPDLLARWTGPLGGDWRRDYRIIIEAVERAVAPVHLGIFTELGTVRELLREYEPGGWARAVAVRDVIVHPTPPYMAVALGADAVRAAARESARWLGGIETLGQLAPLATYLRSRVAEVASVTATLGFDPLKLLAIWLRRAEGEVDVDVEVAPDPDT